MEELKLLNNIENIVAIGDSFELRVSGYSMLPLLGYGRDTIVVRRIDSEHSILHRIAMFRTADSRIVVHRVIALVGDEVVLRGDGNLYGVERCKRNEIIGVVESVRRQSGKVVRCDTRLWRLRERIWLGQPMVVRRYALAIMRRWLNFKSKNI